MKKLYLSICRIITAACVLLALATIALYLYTSFYARPTGDDLGFSYRAHRAWEETHSFSKTLNATVTEVKYQRDACASDFTMVFLVSLMPEVFKTGTFWINCWFILFLLAFSIVFFMKEIFINRFHLPISIGLLFSCISVFLILQQMPSTNSGMYWYSGAVHYPLAFSMSLLFISCSSRFLRTGNKWQIILLCFLAIVIGGDGYFATVSLVVLFFFLALWGVRKKEKKIFFLIIPLAILIICCLICITGEGPNRIRANGQLSFSASLALKAVFSSVIRSIERAFTWIMGKFFVIPCISIFIFALIHGVNWETVSFDFPRPILVLPVLFLTYAAVYSPWVYSEYFDEFGASKGPENYCFFTFVIVLMISITYVLGYVCKKYGELSIGRFGYIFGVALLMVCLCSAFLNRHALKETHGWIGTEYILSEQAADYKEQCKLNMELLLNPNIQDVELIPTNADQGLLCNMVATENPEDFTSFVYAYFYGKNSVVMITH